MVAVPSLAATGVAAAAGFAISATWYVVFDRRRAILLDNGVQLEPVRPPVWKLAVELARSGIVAAGIGLLVATLNVVTWTVAVAVAAAIWVALPVVLLAGSVLWDDVPTELAAIHAGDWLLKLLAMTVIVAVLA